MSSDLRLLFARICILLDQSPSHSLIALSKEFQVSPQVIQKVVASMTNREFTKFKDDVLIAKLTRLLLARPTASIKELSSDLGYKSSRSFARQVGRACGTSPAQLRARIAAELALQNGVGELATGLPAVFPASRENPAEASTEQPA